MSTIRFRAAAVVGVTAAALVLTAPTAASAHVVVDATSTAPGTESTLSFTIEHGCEESPTTRVTIGIPDDVSSVTPVANAGWDIDYALDGDDRSMTYTAQTPLPSPVHDTLELDVTLPDDAEEGTQLVFPVEQECETGSHAWTSPNAGSENPAPTLTIAEPAEAGSAADDAAPTDNGPLTIAALLVALAAVALATIALRKQAAR